MLEKDVEHYLVKEIRLRLGGIAYKFTSPARRSVPDRLCLVPNNIMFFVEVKAPGKLPTKKQVNEIAKIRRLSFRVHVVDSKEGVKGLINFYIREQTECLNLNTHTSDRNTSDKKEKDNG